MPGTAPRVTPADATRSQPQSAPCSMLLDCGDGVIGAGGLKAAVVAEPRAQQVLVAANQLDRDASHKRARFRSTSMLSFSWQLSHSAAPGRAITTTSMAGRSALCLRNDSLTRRLIRFRWTADLETLRDTANPSRAARPVPEATMMVKQKSLRRRPDLNTRVNSTGDSRRRLRGKRCDGAGFAVLPPLLVAAGRTSDSEASAALGAPPGQHLAAVLRGHAGAETMRPFPPQIARLIRAFHRRGPVREVPLARPSEARQKDGKSYAARNGVSTKRELTPGWRPAVDNPGPAS
jgi:hypothetical protein